MNKLSTDDAGKLKDEIYQVIQQAPRRMKNFEIEEAVTLAYKQALGIPVEVELVKHYSERPKPMRIFSIGRDPEEAIKTFFIETEGADKVIIRDQLPNEDEASKEEFPWGFYITVDGTGYKVAGTYISGYAVLTWWK